jgi:hypothetical protein
MRTRWILAASILVLTLIPGALRAAEAPAPATAAVINAPAAEPVSAAPALPVWTGLADQNFTQQVPQGEAPNPLFMTLCSGCTPPQCSRLQSCVLNHCC